MLLRPMATKASSMYWKGFFRFFTMPTTRLASLSLSMADLI
jgi:hypothetical protein